MGDYKLIVGYPGLPCDWLQVSRREEGVDLEKSCPKANISERGIYLYNLKGKLIHFFINVYFLLRKIRIFQSFVPILFSRNSKV